MSGTGYEVALPTVAQVEESLEEIADVLRPGTWEDVVARAGLDRTTPDRTTPDRGADDRAALDRLLAVMSGSADPLVALCARSFAVRVEAHDLLSAGHAAFEGVRRVPRQRAPEPIRPPGPAPRIRAAATDPGRLRELARYDLDAPGVRARLDEITARTRAELGQSFSLVSLVSLVLGNAQIIAGSSGLTGWTAEVGGTPLEWSFCAHVVASGQPYVVEDAVHDDVQSSNPAVTVDGVGCYAGVPLISRSGHALGAHCVVGGEPHHFTAEELAVLERASADVLAVLDEARTRAA